MSISDPFQHLIFHSFVSEPSPSFVYFHGGLVSAPPRSLTPNSQTPQDPHRSLPPSLHLLFMALLYFSSTQTTPSHSNSHHSLDLSEHTVYLIESQQQGSPPKRWLVKVFQDQHGRMHLLDPLSRSKIVGFDNLLLDLREFKVFELCQEHVLRRTATYGVHLGGVVQLSRLTRLLSCVWAQKTMILRW